MPASGSKTKSHGEGETHLVGSGFYCNDGDLFRIWDYFWMQLGQTKPCPDAIILTHPHLKAVTMSTEHSGGRKLYV